MNTFLKTMLFEKRECDRCKKTINEKETCFLEDEEVGINDYKTTIYCSNCFWEILEANTRVFI